MTRRFAARCSFEHHRLTIHTELSTLILDAWPLMTARRRTPTEGWRSFVPDFRLLAPRSSAPRLVHADASGAAPSRLRARKVAFDGFRAELQPEVAERVAPFRQGQWPLLVLLARDRDALDLLRSNPTLAYLLAGQARARRTAIVRLRAGRRRQRDLLETLRLPAREALVRRLRRIEPRAATSVSRAALLRLLRKPELEKALGHLDPINAGALALLVDARLFGRVTPRLLEEVATDPRERALPRAARLLGRVLAMRGRHEGLRPLGPIGSLARLERIHEETTRAFTRLQKRLRELRAMGLENFRWPPIPGVSGATEPLASPDALLWESLWQRNCCDTHVKEVAEGSHYLYRVLQPERATVMIAREGAGPWRIAELRAHANAPVRRATEVAVERWLSRHQPESLTGEEPLRR